MLVVGTIQHYDSLLARLTNRVKSPLSEGRVYRSVVRVHPDTLSPTLSLGKGEGDSGSAINWSTRPELWGTWSALLRRREELDGDTGVEAAHRYFEANREAMLENTDVLWPGNEDYYALMRMRESEGPASFDSEKQNEPVNPADCLFLEEEFHYWDDRWESSAELIAAVGKNACWVGACDPSLGKSGKHADDSAIVTLLRDSSTGTLYVIDADIQRRKPDLIIENVLTYQRLRRYTNFAFESNQPVGSAVRTPARRTVRTADPTICRSSRLCTPATSWRGFRVSSHWCDPGRCSSRGGTPCCWSR